MVTEIKEQTPPAIEPVANPEPIAPVELPFSRESETYKILRDKGNTDQQILDMYKTAKSNYNPRKEVQAPTPAPIQEPVKIDDKNQTFKLPDQQDQKKVEQATLEPLPISEYQDNSTERQNQIVSNLNQYRTSNPEYMKDLDTFKKTFSYDMRVPEQKQVLDTWYKGYQRWVELDSISAGDIVNRYNKNITATDLEQLKLQNPVKYKEVKETLDKKTVLDSLKSELYGNDTTIQEPVKVEEPVKQGNFFDEYRKTINSDEVKWYKTELSNKAGEIKQLQLDLATIKKDVEKQYEWTGASRSKINAIIADQQTEINNKLSALGIDYQTTLDKYNSIVNTAKETMELGLKQQQADMDAKNQKMKELGFYYEYDPKGMAERAASIFDIENPDIDSKNPQTARMALSKELAKYYEQYWDIISRPQSQALNDILAQAKAQNISVSEALKQNFIKPLQSKWLYGVKLQKSMGLDFDNYSLVQDENWNWNIEDKTVSEWWQFDWNSPTVTSRWLKNGNPSDKWIDYDVKKWDKIPTPYAWTITEVGKRDDGTVYTNVVTDDWTLIQFNHLDNSTLNQFKAGTKVNAGDIIWIGWNTGKVIAGKGWDWSHIDVWVKQKDWTYLTGRDADAYLRWATRKTYEPTASELAYFNKWAAGIDPKGKNWITKAKYDQIAEWKKQNEKWVVNPLSDDQRIVYNNQLSSFRGNQQVKLFEDGMTQYQNIQSSLDNVSWPWDVAAIFQFMKSLDPSSVVRESEFEVAAKSAGVAAYIGNAYDRISKWEKLTEKQREAFGKLAKQFIINRGKSYDRLYDDMARVFDNMGIDKTYRPTRATDVLNSSIEEQWSEWVWFNANSYKKPAQQEWDVLDWIY